MLSNRLWSSLWTSPVNGYKHQPLHHAHWGPRPLWVPERQAFHKQSQRQKQRMLRNGQNALRAETTADDGWESNDCYSEWRQSQISTCAIHAIMQYCNSFWHWCDTHHYHLMHDSFDWVMPTRHISNWIWSRYQIIPKNKYTKYIWIDIITHVQLWGVAHEIWWSSFLVIETFMYSN